MSSRNIAVRKDVYDALRKERHPGESFTKLLDRMLTQRGALADLVGVWSSRPARADRAHWRSLRGLAGAVRGRSR